MLASALKAMLLHEQKFTEIPNFLLCLDDKVLSASLTRVKAAQFCGLAGLLRIL